MRKLFIVLFCLSLCACAKGEKYTSFDAGVTISVGESVYECLYEKRIGSDRLIVLSPDRLFGSEFLLCDGVCTVSFDNLSFESEEFSAVFDFLPIEGECEKTVGDRRYRIHDLRGVQ